MKLRQHAFPLLTLAALQSACSLVPTYQAPAPAAPQHWQAALPHGGNTADLVHWWGQFDDPTLTDLLQAAERDHPSLEKAAAAIREARAAITSSKAAGLPAVTGTASDQRSSSNPLLHTPAATTRTAELDASWEIDIFGAVRYATESAQAQAKAREDDWHNARISLAAEVATNYVSYRACQQQVEAYQAELVSQQATAGLTETLAQAGFNAPADANLARASVASTSATLTAQQESCDLTVKSLVALTGLDESDLRAKLSTGKTDIPAPAGFAVNDLPASQISQRPDVGAAERTLAATYADIGSAEADRYPRLSLLGTITATAAGGVSATTWSFGPSLTAPLFDAGKRRANAEAARARYDQALASYKQTVRSAVEETEQALVRLESANRREQDARTAAANYRAYLTASEQLWKSGGMSLLDLETARRSAISADLNVITLKRDQVNDWIALYKAFGGDWQAVPAPGTTISSKEAKQQ
jgi:NodT family efflux transporter outer membrane factor (OMF) lipoprotein